MIHPTRTNLLLLKEKNISVYKSIGILKARRLALIKEFLNTVKPFIKSREEIRQLYGEAIYQLLLASSEEGAEQIKSLTLVERRELGLRVTQESVWGLKYKNVMVEEKIVRRVDERNYDYIPTSSKLEEATYRFEKILEEMIKIAKLEAKINRLATEILKTTRKIKTLEDRVLPKVKHDIDFIYQYLGERERESYYRLKIFKKSR